MSVCLRMQTNPYLPDTIMNTQSPRNPNLKLTLNIIGSGKVGQTLGRLWANSQTFAIQNLLNRDPAHSRQAAAFIGAGCAVEHYDALQPADVTLITTRDDQIADCCAKLGDHGLFGPDSIVFHCSGALPSGILAPAAQRGAAIASAHPVASFAEPEEMIARFRGVYCATEGDPRAVRVIDEAFGAIGAVPVMIDGSAKTVYHAAAVFASNYVVTLLDIAARLYEKSGIDRSTAYAMMQPLVEGSTGNVFRLGAAAALTGPIARGDAATVMRQHAALETLDAQIGALYAQLAGFTAVLARQPNPLQDWLPPRE